MAEETTEIIKPIKKVKTKTYISSLKQYQEMYDQSINEPDKFWARIAEMNVSFFKRWDKVRDFDFNEGKINWYKGAKLNVSYNCLDRHVDVGRGNDTAIIWEGNQPGTDKTFTYKELLAEVSKFSNVLKSKGVKKGDRVCIYLQMIPELAISMLACARIGAVHSIVFGGFSADSLRDRINDSECKILITQDTGVRGAKKIPMKTTCDEAVKDTPSIESVIVVDHQKQEVPMGKNDCWWHKEMEKADPVCPPEEMDAEDPLFILYTSGSTGKPKGVLHTQAGYLVYAAVTFKYIFDYREGDVYWCTADIGWITGHSYIIYGPLANKAISVMFEGVPNYPNWGRFWEICEKYGVNIFYTAPTALRALMKQGDDWVKEHDLGSLKLLGTVGEPIKSKEWHWYHSLVGGGRCPIVDTWWQTETGGILISPLPGVTGLKPGSATVPFFGVEPVLMDDKGKEISGNSVEGNLAIKSAWPGMMRTVYGDHERFKKTYFSTYKGYYFTGDGCRRDTDGYFWITGRVDDVINVSGHRIGTAEVEGALGKHPKVAEAAVVGFPHEIKGQGIYAYITLKSGEKVDENLTKELVQKVRTEIGAIASPDKIQFSEGLPKTRSGKIMRRILRKIADGKIEDVGDTSTLADPKVVDSLIKNRK